MSVQHRRFVSPLLLALVFIGSPASAADDETGFFLRSTLGMGHSWTHAEATDDQPDVGMQAWAGGLMLSPGYQFLPGLAAHADIYGAMHFAHKLNPDSDAGDYAKGGIGMMGFILGLGLTINHKLEGLYVSGGLGFSRYVWGSRWQRVGDVADQELAVSTAASYPGYALYDPSAGSTMCTSVGPLGHP